LRKDLKILREKFLSKPGTLFNTLYKDLELNSPEVEAGKRKLEKKKAARNSILNDGLVIVVNI